MQISTRFSVSIHILLGALVFKDSYKVTSDLLASSVNTNPVVIRKLMSRLKEAGLIHTALGTGGIELAKPLDEITLKDIYIASEENQQIISIHKNSAGACPVGGNIEGLLTPFFSTVEDEIKEKLSKITLKDLSENLNTMIESKEQN